MDDWSQAQIRIKCSLVLCLCSEGQGRTLGQQSSQRERFMFGLVRRQEKSLVLWQTAYGHGGECIEFNARSDGALFGKKHKYVETILPQSGRTLGSRDSASFPLYFNSLYSSQNRALLAWIAPFLDVALWHKPCFLKKRRSVIVAHIN